MPVKSSSIRVFTWPDRETVDRAVRAWATAAAAAHPEVLRIGYFGSYARGDWGVGSDVDLVLVVTHCGKPWHERRSDWDTLHLPVPVDVLVYTEAELAAMRAAGRRMAAVLDLETVWVYERR